MKSSKEFFERLKNDEAFSKEVAEAIIAKREAGAANYYETYIPVANERGYELSKEELDTILAASTEELTEEELGKVAGGTSCLIPAIIFVTVTSTVMTASLTVSIVTAIKNSQDGF